MDGITFLREVNAHPNHKLTPVVMLTPAAGQDMEAGKAAGAKAWITKPFQPGSLFSAVAKLVLA